MNLFEKILKFSTDVPKQLEASACFPDLKSTGEEDWKEALKKASAEGLVACCYKAAERLGCPETILELWKKLTEEILIVSEINHSQTEQARLVLEKIGIKALPFKGAILAAYYPEPKLRFYQDIDLWARGSREDTVSKLKAAGFRVTDILSHECKANLGTGVPTDIHFTPQKFNNPFRNRKLQKYFAETEETSTSFWLVYCLTHILRHTINNKISWKSILDYHYLLKAASPEEKSKAKSEISFLKLGDIASDICWVLHEEFGDETDDFFAPNQKGGSHLLKELRRSEIQVEGTVRKFIAKTLGIFSHISFYPSEVIFSPYARTRQFIWRKVKKF